MFKRNIPVGFSGLSLVTLWCLILPPVHNDKLQSCCLLRFHVFYALILVKLLLESHPECPVAFRHAPVGQKLLQVI